MSQSGPSPSAQTAILALSAIPFVVLGIFFLYRAVGGEQTGWLRTFEFGMGFVFLSLVAIRIWMYRRIRRSRAG